MLIPAIAHNRLQAYINKLLFRADRWKTAPLMETMIRNPMAEDKHAKRDLCSFVADALCAKDDGSFRLNGLWFESFVFTIAANGSGKEIRGTKLAGWQYPRVCIDEVLGMSPLVPVPIYVLPTSPQVREAFPSRRFYSAYASVEANASTSDRSTSQTPLRIIEPAGWHLRTPKAGRQPQQRKAMHDVFAAFSVGARGCAGKPMANLEANPALAKTF
ncbi:hypothetical protein DL767_000144 [Monosporascus sp. MG133]|nr:hypothetical protein DL767_000144 [Monosporascus sp. MG133]